MLISAESLQSGVETFSFFCETLGVHFCLIVTVQMGTMEGKRGVLHAAKVHGQSQTGDLAVPGPFYYAC